VQDVGRPIRIPRRAERVGCRPMTRRTAGAYGRLLQTAITPPYADVAIPSSSDRLLRGPGGSHGLLVGRFSVLLTDEAMGHKPVCKKPALRTHPRTARSTFMIATSCIASLGQPSNTSFGKGAGMAGTHCEGVRHSLFPHESTPTFLIGGHKP
jgi:hypothetical protein